MPVPRFVELVRVSSQGQADRDTPEDQRRSLDRLRVSRPGVLVERIDFAISGAKAADDRKDIQRLAELARERAFDEVRVRHTDRLTRHDDPRERFAVYGIIADAGSVIVDASGRVIDPKSEMGEMAWYFETLMASKERRRIVERTGAAKHRLAAEGRLVSGKPPFARTWDLKLGWGIDEKKAELYRKLFAMVLAGRSLRQISATLNAKGEVTPSGVAWNASRVSNLLRCQTATGRYTSHGHTCRIPPIVDDETFAAVGARLKTNNSLSGPRPTIPAMLRKLLTCGLCESPMYVDKGGHRNDRHHYYVCSSRADDCHFFHRVDRVDAVVRERLEAWLARPSVLKAATDADRPKAEMIEAAQEVREAERELKDLDRQEERVARLLRKELLSPKGGEKQLAEVQRLRASAEQQLLGAQAREKAAAQRSEVALALDAKLVELRNKIGKKTPKAWRALCELLFPRTPTTGVRLFPDGALELWGTVILDDTGAATLARSARKPPGVLPGAARRCCARPPAPG